MYMPRAYVLFNVEAGSEDKTLQELRKIDEIQESYVAYGVYDLIAKVKADTMEKLKNTVTNRIRAIPTVRSSLTLIMMEE
jgi:DNA-binding Lrp family transcriptional regulator